MHAPGVTGRGVIRSWGKYLAQPIVVEFGLIVLVSVVVVLSAIAAKELATAEPLVALETEPMGPALLDPVVMTMLDDALDEDESEAGGMGAGGGAGGAGGILPAEPDAQEIRWFQGRPITPDRVIWMTVTAYSPDARSCGRFADGKTATLHSVWTNGTRLVAADTKVLPFGSMLSIPGYDNENVVPVLDRGGAIKGHRLDVLFPSHKRARQWGVKKLPVVVWKFADGKGLVDPRQYR